MRRLLVPVLLTAAALAHAEEAHGACASAVVVDGRLLLGGVVQHPDRLPPREGERDAIFPACNDTGGDEPDEQTTVVRLRGLPPRVAAAQRGRPDSVYLDEGSLTAIGTHPLHAAQFGSPRTPSYREHRHCRPYRTAVRGEVLRDGVLRIRTARRTVFVSVDAATRFTNRPVYEPVLKGQRLRLATSHCGPRRVADRVTFVGPVPTPGTDGPTAAPDGGFHVAGWQVVLVLVFGSAAAMIALIWKYVGR
jgi:hypothetical protein